MALYEIKTQAPKNTTDSDRVPGNLATPKQVKAVLAFGRQPAAQGLFGPYVMEEGAVEALYRSEASALMNMSRSAMATLSVLERVGHLNVPAKSPLKGMLEAFRQEQQRRHDAEVAPTPTPRVTKRRPRAKK